MNRKSKTEVNEQKTYFGRDLEAMSFARNYHAWVLENFIPYLHGNVAEVGAGSGNFSEMLLETDIAHLSSFEPSSNMFTALERKFSGVSGINTINSFFEGDLKHYANLFDAVCYVNVLEHIDDDEKALSYTYETLHRNGHVVIFVPALSWLYSDFDKKVGHYRRYSKKQLIDVVSAAGFSIKEAKYFDIAGIVPWYIAFVLLRQITTNANVSMYDKLVVPIMRNIEQVITPCIGKNLILVGQKE